MNRFNLLTNIRFSNTILLHSSNDTKSLPVKAGLYNIYKYFDHSKHNKYLFVHNHYDYSFMKHIPDLRSINLGQIKNLHIKDLNSSNSVTYSCDDKLDTKLYASFHSYLHEYFLLSPILNMESMISLK